MFRWYERVISEHVKEPVWCKLSNLWNMQAIIDSKRRAFYDTIVLSDEEFFMCSLDGGSTFHYKLMKVEDVVG